MTNQSCKHVFISYARDQSNGQQLAESLHKQLLKEEIPVFRDEGGIDPGADWADTLETAVRNSAVVVLVLSSKVTDSKWVRREFNLAESLGLTIIPVLAEAMPLPWWMTNYQLVDFSVKHDWSQLIPFVKEYCAADVTPVHETSQADLDAPAWAALVGEDEFGCFADLQVESVTQCLRLIKPVNQSAFWMADTPCTQALWLEVMGKNPAEFASNSQNPVERVSWADVQRFLNQLNQTTPELQARLPSEKEWELACQAGMDAPYSFGDKLTTEHANIAGTATTIVKSFPANSYGLYDMHGNIWEWCEDDADSWGNQKVLRGGCWALDAEAARSDSRGQSAVANRDYSIGFRFVI